MTCDSTGEDSLAEVEKYLRALSGAVGPRMQLVLADFPKAQEDNLDAINAATAPVVEPYSQLYGQILGTLNPHRSNREAELCDSSTKRLSLLETFHDPEAASQRFITYLNSRPTPFTGELVTLSGEFGDSFGWAKMVCVLGRRGATGPAAKLLLAHWASGSDGSHKELARLAALSVVAHCQELSDEQSMSLLRAGGYSLPRELATGGVNRKEVLSEFDQFNRKSRSKRLPGPVGRGE